MIHISHIVLPETPHFVVANFALLRKIHFFDHSCLEQVLILSCAVVRRVQN